MTQPALLLMRESPAQNYCANALFRRGVISAVYVEEGASMELQGRALWRRLVGYGPSGILKRLGRDLAHFQGDVWRCLDYYATRVATRSLLNRQSFHHVKILGRRQIPLDPALRQIRDVSVNSPSCEALIRQGGYRLVFVFGTRILQDQLVSIPGVTFVNLHWGWLPNYRGEGIISALAEEGVRGLGVSVHLIDGGVDTGSVLYRQRLTIEPGDNAYAIGLRATLAGIELFGRVFEDAGRDPVRGMPQTPEDGRLYTASDLKTRYRLRRAALRALRRNRGGSSDLQRVTKLAAAAACAAAGQTAWARRRHGHRLRILMYHGVLERVNGPAGFGDLFLSREVFAGHMRHLAKEFNVLALEEAARLLTSGEQLPERAAAITFDDGYRNTITCALPVLRSLRLPSTVFLPPALTGTQELFWFDALRGFAADPRAYDAQLETIRQLVPREQDAAISRLLAQSRAQRLWQRYPEFALADWNEWRQAVAEGGLEIGSHSLAHADLARLPAEELGEDLRRSKQLIETELGRACRAIAYPYGVWDAGVAKAARETGYAYGVTTDDGLNGPGQDPMMLRRTMIGDKGSLMMFRARVSGVWEWMRTAAPRSVEPARSPVPLSASVLDA